MVFEMRSRLYSNVRPSEHSSRGGVTMHALVHTSHNSSAAPVGICWHLLMALWIPTCKQAETVRLCSRKWCVPSSALFASGVLRQVDQGEDKSKSSWNSLAGTSSFDFNWGTCSSERDWISHQAVVILLKLRYFVSSLPVHDLDNMRIWIGDVHDVCEHDDGRCVKFATAFQIQSGSSLYVMMMHLLGEQYDAPRRKHKPMFASEERASWSAVGLSQRTSASLLPFALASGFRWMSSCCQRAGARNPSAFVVRAVLSHGTCGLGRPSICLPLQRQEERYSSESCEQFSHGGCSRYGMYGQKTERYVAMVRFYERCNGDSSENHSDKTDESLLQPWSGLRCCGLECRTK